MININFHTTKLEDFLTAVEYCREKELNFNTTIAQPPDKRKIKGEWQSKLALKIGKMPRLRDSVVKGFRLRGTKEEMYKQLYEGLEDGSIEYVDNEYVVGGKVFEAMDNEDGKRRGALTLDVSDIDPDEVD